MKVGLFFGSFNPIHVGHLIIANYFHEFTDLDEIWFVVSPQNPFKTNQKLATDQARIDMVNLAIAGIDGYRSCDIELNMPRPSYTYRTLEALTNKYPQHEFVLIMGGDNIVSFHKWLNYNWIVSNFEIYVYPRPGYEIVNMKERNIHVVKAPLMEISASFIRESIKQGHEIDFFLHPRVAEYIKQKGLYK